MAIQKRLKERLSEEQIQEYMKWEERWKGKRWYGEDGNKRFDELLEIVLPGYKRKGEVTGRFKKVIIECDRGHDWEVQPNNIRIGQQCPICSKSSRSKSAKEVFQIIIEKYGYELDVSTFKKMGEKARFKCPNGNWFWRKPANIISGLQKCPCNYCKKSRGRKKKRTMEEYINELKQRGFFLDPKDWKGYNRKTKLWCMNGKHYTEQQPNNILNNGYGCAVCSKKVKYTIEDVQKEFESEGYTIKEGSNYINALTPIPVRCPQGHDWEVSLVNFREGKRCRKCFIEGISGENNINWNPDLTQEEREKGRNTKEDNETRKACYERDNYICVVSGKPGDGDLVHHHLDGHHWCHERRWDLNNVVTLNRDVHSEYHRIYGHWWSTRDKFIEFLYNLIDANKFPERKEHILKLIGWIEETRDKTDFSHLEVIKEEGTSN